MYTINKNIFKDALRARLGWAGAWGLCLLLLFQTGCKKLVDVGGPSTSLTGADVYTSDATAAAVLTGLYATMSSGGAVGSFATGINSISVQAGLSADELTLWSGISNTTYVAQYQNALSSNVAPAF